MKWTSCETGYTVANENVSIMYEYISQIGRNLEMRANKQITADIELLLNLSCKIELEQHS